MNRQDCFGARVDDDRHESERIMALRSLHLLSSEADPAFNRITALAKRLTGADVSLITLLDDTRQWFKSCAGPLEGSGTPREEAICNFTIQGEGVLWVEDAQVHPVFGGYPGVAGEPHIRFYAGAPIVVDEYAIGSLCLLGFEPRSYDPDVADLLQDLAAITAQQARLHGALPKLKAYADAVRDREQRYEALFQRSTEGLAVVERTQDGGFVYTEMNKAMEDITGLSPALIGRSPREVFGEQANTLEALYAEAIAAGGSRSWTQAYDLPRGHRYIDVVLAPIAPSSNGGARLLISGRDVTDRELADRSAKEIERKFRQLFEGSSDALIFLRRGGDGRWVHEHANRAALELFGCSEQEVIGRTPEDVFGPEAGEELSRRAAECLREGAVLEHDASYAPRNVEKSFHAAMAPMYSEDGEPWGVLVSARDMTSQHRELASSFEAQKFEAIGQLAGGVAHDFNNLLLVIGGFARIGLEPEASMHEARDCLGEVLKATDRADRLVQQLLTFSRRQLLETRPFPVLQSIMETEKLLSPLLGARHPLVVKNTDLSSFVQVETDTAEFSQAITNLVINARDAMPEGGVIQLSLDVIYAQGDSTPDLMGLPAGPYASVSIKDSGVGMDDATQARIFDPFFTTKEQGRGTGLGLAMVHGFARQSGGGIRVESVPGRGSTFHLLLPMSTKAAEPMVVVSDEVVPGAGELILLVEDDPQVCALNEHALKSMGYRVVTARDGFEALEVQGENDVDLVLTDVVMPGLGGFEMAEILRETSPELPVIFTSGYPTRGPSRSFAIPQDAIFISKPYTPAQLARAIRSVLNPVSKITYAA